MILVKTFKANCLFFVSERANEWFAKKKLFRSFAHLLWATWANCSQSLIYHEQPDRFANSRSFVLSLLTDLSKALTVDHLIWAIWANRSQLLIWSERSKQMSNEQMSWFPTLTVSYCSTHYIKLIYQSQETKCRIKIKSVQWILP